MFKILNFYLAKAKLVEREGNISKLHNYFNILHLKTDKNKQKSVRIQKN